MLQKLLLTMTLSITLFLSGCANFAGFDMTNQTQQLMVKTTIQLATATYLDKSNNAKSVELVLQVTEEVMTYLTGTNFYNDTVNGLQSKLHYYIAEKNISVAQKIALTSLGDLIIAQAIHWGQMSLGDNLTDAHSDVLFFCADTMNEVAKMYKLPNVRGRSFSVNTTKEITL